MSTKSPCLLDQEYQPKLDIYSIWEKEFVESTFFEKKFPSTPHKKKF